MVLHYFKIVWARRKNNFLVVLTLFFAFCVISFFGMLLVAKLVYIWFPTGINHAHVYHMHITPQGEPDPGDVKKMMSLIQDQLDLMPEFETISITPRTVPYARLLNSKVLLKYEGQEIDYKYADVDEHFQELLEIEQASGRWFRPTDGQANIQPMIINQITAERLFNDEDPIGKIVTTERRIRDGNKEVSEWQIIGVVRKYRNMAADRPGPVGFAYYDMKDPEANIPANILISHRPGMDSEKLEEKVENIVNNYPAGEGWNFGIASSLEEWREIELRLYKGFMIMGVVIGIILFSNVAVGIFGVFWNNVLRRYSEIGIRRAMGSTRKGIYRQILGEAAALATISVVSGAIVMIQVLWFYFGAANSFKNGDFFMSMLLAAVLIYGLVLLCAIYPGWLATQIQPATALHEE